jgi:hypothetical protein
MQFTLRLFCFSSCLIFIAWIAKMQFIFGGDYLFRLGTFGVLISLIVQINQMLKMAELNLKKLVNVYIINSICLFVVYLGMMMKVSHIMNSQLEKDFVLDFIGIPAILTSIMYTYLHIDKLLETSRTNKVVFYKQILLPWTLFLFSFLLYAVYSVILTRA